MLASNLNVHYGGCFLEWEAFRKYFNLPGLYSDSDDGDDREADAIYMAILK